MPGQGSYLDPRNWPGSPENAAATNDPMELIRSILGAPPPDFGSDADRQLSGIYDPLYGQLDQQIAAANSRARESDAALNAMYRALAGSIKNDRGQIVGNYKDASNAVNSAYKQGIGSIQNAYAQGNQQLAGIFQQLGIEDAATDPRTLGQNVQDANWMTGLLNVNNQASKNALTQQKAGTLDYNTALQASSKSEGAMQRSALQRSLQDRLAQFDQQRSNLQSQEAAATNDLVQRLQQQWMTQQQGLADSAMSSWEAQQKAAADQAAQNQANQPSAYQQWQMMGPVDRTLSQATQYLGDPSKANQAVALLSDMGAGGRYDNGFQFIEDAVKRNNAAGTGISDGEMRTLAGFFWQQMKPATAPNYQPSTYQQN